MLMLSPVDAIFIASIVEDCIESILNVGNFKEFRRFKDFLPHTIDSSENLGNLYIAHVHLEKKYEIMYVQSKELLENKTEYRSIKFNLAKEGIQPRITKLKEVVDASKYVLFQDVEAKFLNIQEVIISLLNLTKYEILNSGWYESLKIKNQIEKNRLERDAKLVQDEITEYMHCHKLLTLMEHEFFEMKETIKDRIDQIDKSKSYLEEMKVLKIAENDYAKKLSDTHVIHMQKRHKHEVTQTKKQLMQTKRDIRNENRVHRIMVRFLEEQINKKRDELTKWVDKYDTEVEEKTKDLKDLIENRERDLSSFELISKKIIEFELVVLDYDREKEISAKKVIQNELELKSALRIQAWWKAMMVRKCLGIFKMGKKKKRKGKGKKAAGGGLKKK